MGLAASQARFLCITARKADCEYRSTELAQQKLDITKQMSDISNQYAQAMNATKLVWSHEGLAADCAMTYGLMMLPSAANDFNPYLITSPSGAIVLNTEYAAAARAAGISKAGGVGSQDSRDKFIAVLAYQGLVTEPTADAIMKNDYKVDAEETKKAGSIQFTGGASGASGITWNPGAGLGSTPLNKGGSVSVMTLADLTLSESIGQQPIDWALLGTPDGEMTEMQYDAEKDRLNQLVRDANSENPITDDIIRELQRMRNEKNDEYTEKLETDTSTYNDEQKAAHAADVASLQAAVNEFDVNIAIAKNYYNNDTKDTDLVDFVRTKLTERYNDHKKVSPSSVDIEEAKVNTKGNRLGVEGTTYSIVENGLINHNKTELEEMTIGDIINKNIVLMSNDEKLEDFRKKCS